MTSPSVVENKQTLLLEWEEGIEERLKEIFPSWQGREDELIPILQQVQEAFGYLPEPAMKKVAKFLRLPESTVFGVSTFYAQFKLVPSGRNIIRVCRGTACHVRGGARILREVEKQLGIKAEETTPDFEYSLETVACLGACALAPNIVVNGKVYGRVAQSGVKKILAGTKEA